MISLSQLSDPHAENAILGALLNWPDETVERVRSLEPFMFSLDNHRTIFRVLREMFSEGVTIDLITFRERLRRMLLLQDPVDRALVVDLGMNLPQNFDVTAYAGIVREKWRLREIVRIASTYGARAQDPGSDSSDELLSLMQSEVFDAMQDARAVEDPLVAAYTVDALESCLDTTVSPMGWSYGHEELDLFTMGMQPAEVTVVGARSGVGKTVLMAQAARASCRAGHAVDLFSLEMRKVQMLYRLWSLESGVPFIAIRRKLLDDTQRRTVREAAYRVAEWKLRIHDDGDMTLSQIASQARLSARRHGMVWFGVDYAQIVNAEGKDDRERVARTSRTLTKLAKKEGVHCMLLSQLSKVDHWQYSKPPSVRDLADTRQLENDAHAIVLIHRGWDEERRQVMADGEFICPKLRNEATGSRPVVFNSRVLRFDSAGSQRQVA